MVISNENDLVSLWKTPVLGNVLPSFPLEGALPVLGNSLLVIQYLLSQGFGESGSWFVYTFLAKFQNFFEMRVAVYIRLRWLAPILRPGNSLTLSGAWGWMGSGPLGTGHEPGCGRFPAGGDFCNSKVPLASGMTLLTSWETSHGKCFPPRDGLLPFYFLPFPSHYSPFSVTLEESNNFHFSLELMPELNCLEYLLNGKEAGASRLFVLASISLLMKS